MMAETGTQQSGAVVSEETLWIRAAQRGDVDAFNRLVEHFQARAYAVAYRSLGNPHDAADATQDAFLSAYRAIGGFRGDSFAAWLFRIVVNACRDAQRRARRRPADSMDALADELGDPPWADPAARDPEGEALSGEVRATIEEALQRLPEEQRLAIVLVDMDGLSYEEAAEVLGCAVGTIRSRLARGRMRVREELLAAGNLS